MLRWFGLVAAVGAVGCTTEEPVPPPPPPCYAQAAEGPACPALGGACERLAEAGPAIGEATPIVPSTMMPDGVVSQVSHNNLDIVWHRGRLFFAFRTAPTHFAGESTVLYVVSTVDQEHWTFETSFALGTDLREPRFVVVGDRLFLYFAVLGQNPFTFEPQGTRVSEQLGGCQWTASELVEPVAGEPDFIPWRSRVIDGQTELIGYTGGADIYDVTGEAAIDVHWLTTADGRTFEPVLPGQSVVLHGGSSETDFARLDDGSLVAVSRNEAGDELGFGSKICTAEAGALGDWECVADPKKYDSPLVIEHGGEVWLIGRRNLTADGNYDLGHDQDPPETQALDYQLAYWTAPKRCSLWHVDPATRAVEFVLDLPSKGDTCFASAIDLGDDHFLVYNYTSPVDGEDVNWSDGQYGPTSIYGIVLRLP
jgi:hypothetical protein